MIPRMLEMCLRKLVTLSAIGLGLFSGVQAFGRTITIVYSGTVSQGVDIGGIFGSRNGDLKGKRFVVVFRFDDAMGKQQRSQPCLPSACVSSFGGQYPSSPGTAALTIDGKTHTFGLLTTKPFVPGPVPLSMATRTIRDEPSINYHLFTMFASASSSSDQVTVSAVGPTDRSIPTKNPDWYAPLCLSSADIGSSAGDFSITTTDGETKASLLVDAVSVADACPSSMPIPMPDQKQQSNETYKPSASEARDHPREDRQRPAPRTGNESNRDLSARIVTMTFEGHLSSGVDNSGILGAPRTDLKGEPFVLVVTIDSQKGTVRLQPPTCSSGSCASHTSGQFDKSPATATLQIHNHSYTFGVASEAGPVPNLHFYSNAQRNVMKLPTYQMFQISADVRDFRSNVTAGVSLTEPPDAIFDADWRAPFCKSNLGQSGLEQGGGTFAIDKPDGTAGSSGVLVVEKLSVQGACSNNPAGAEKNESAEERARDIIHLLAANQFETVVSRFNAEMARQVPLERLRSGVWPRMIQTYGPFQNIVSVETGQDSREVDLICALRDGNIHVRIVFDDHQLVAGLWIQASR